MQRKHWPSKKKLIVKVSGWDVMKVLDVNPKDNLRVCFFFKN